MFTACSTFLVPQATLRADACVCSRSKENNHLYFNVMAFQQQQGIDLESGELKKERRLWLSWLQQTVVILNGDCSTRPAGLCRAGVRKLWCDIKVEYQLV